MYLSDKARQLHQHRVVRGMTLIEMLCFIALVVCVIEGAKFGHHIAGRWYGYLLGGILGIFVFLVCIYTLGFVLHLWNRKTSRSNK
jgi:hypothetical protein